MRHVPKFPDGRTRALVFAVLPCLLGLGFAQYLRATDTVWFSIAGSFWPIVLTVASLLILAKLWLSPFDDWTSAIVAWSTLVWSWVYVPMWATALEMPRTSAVVERDGSVHFVAETTRFPDVRIWLLTNSANLKIVNHVSGKLTSNGIEVDYRYAAPYVATRRHHDDLQAPLALAAASVLREEAAKPRASRIALLDDRAVRDATLDRICRAAVAGTAPCPVKLNLTPTNAATSLGGLWSKYYTEKEAVADKHLPTLVRLLTQSESPLVDRDKVFALLLDSAESVAPLSQVAQRPYWLSDDQFEELIRRILVTPGCGNEAVTLIARVKRLSADQRRALRTKALDEAAIATLLDNAMLLHVSDAEVSALSARMLPAFTTDPAVAVRALEVFGERLPPEIRRNAVAAIVKGKPAYALAALGHVNFSADLRRDVFQKAIADADHSDFSTARLSKESLQTSLSQAELRSLIAVAVKKSEMSGAWLDFALGSLAIRDLTPDERSTLVTGLMFKSPKVAMEFVSENRRYLDPAEVVEVTRDYSRTILPDMCLHLSHRNANRGIDYFSEAQLQIFRDCAAPK